MSPAKSLSKSVFRTALAFLVMSMTAGALAQDKKPNELQVPIPTTPAEVPGPVPGNKMIPAYVQLVGRMAYVWDTRS